MRELFLSNGFPAQEENYRRLGRDIETVEAKLKPLTKELNALDSRRRQIALADREKKNARDGATARLKEYLSRPRTRPLGNQLDEEGERLLSEAKAAQHQVDKVNIAIADHLHEVLRLQSRQLLVLQEVGRLIRQRSDLYPKLSKFLQHAAAYSLRFEINENNAATLTAGYTWPIHFGTFTVGIAGGDTRDREAQRDVRLASTFEELLNSDCADLADLLGEYAERPSRYPIRGRVGLQEVFGQYFAINIDKDTRFQKSDEKYKSIIKFTTTVNGSVKPEFRLEPVAPRVVTGSLNLAASRKDIHQLTLVLVPPAPPGSSEEDKVYNVRLVNSGSALDGPQ